MRKYVYTFLLLFAVQSECVLAKGASFFFNFDTRVDFADNFERNIGKTYAFGPNIEFSPILSGVG